MTSYLCIVVVVRFSQSEYLVVTDVQESGVGIYSCHLSLNAQTAQRGANSLAQIVWLVTSLGANIGPGQFILGWTV